MPRVPGTRRWRQMGVELEGGWTNPRSSVAAMATGAQVRDDGSVRDVTGDRGEIVTRPHNILDHLCKDIEILYPNSVNQTCGLHIHTSFVSPQMEGNILDHSFIASDAFYDYYRERWRLWGEANQDAMGRTADTFWERWHGRFVSGRNGRNFCENKRNWELQLSDSNSEHRYTALNFSAWHKYKTVESRLLPMMPTAALAVSAIREMSAIYDDFLNENEFPTIKLDKSFQWEGDTVIEAVDVKMPITTPMETIYEAAMPTLGAKYDPRRRGIRDYLILVPEDEDKVLDEEL